MSAITLSLLVLMASGTTGPQAAALGLKPHVPGPWGYCTATPVHTPQGARWYTARHCLRPDRHPLVFPGLVGSVMELGSARWTTVETKSQWSPLPGAGSDVSWSARSEGPGWTVASAWPQPGAVLIVIGYPQGKGPVRLTCRYRGVALGSTRLEPKSKPVAVLRGSMACPSDDKSHRRMHGFSGGPVVNEQNELVGLLVSGYAAASGQTHPGFEPLIGNRQGAWPADGVHRLRFDPGWDAEPAWLEVRVEKGVLTGMAKVSNATGLVWNTITFP